MSEELETYFKYLLKIHQVSTKSIFTRWRQIFI